MSLAPSLKTTLVTSIAVGVATVEGLTPTVLTDRLLPVTAEMSVSGGIPLVVRSQGPTASVQDQAVLTLSQLIPGLRKFRTIYPILPDAEGEENDLTPVLIENVIEGTSPAQAPLVWSGPIPALIQNGGQYIYPITGSVILNGLAPTSVMHEWEYPDRYPGKVTLETIPLEPTLILMRSAEVEQGSVTIEGLVPDLGTRYGWTTIDSQTSPLWTDIPRV